MAADEITTPSPTSPKAIEDQLKTLNAEMKDLNENAEILNRESRQLLGQLNQDERHARASDVADTKSP